MKTPFRIASRLSLAAAALCSSTAWASAVLWYNGTADGSNALANELVTSFPANRVYENFVVPVGGWTIDRVWSNNLMDFTSTLASWEIRSGVSSGNGGTLVAAGTNATATQTATGRVFTAIQEYTVEVGDLSVFLEAGEYWLNIAPIGQGSGRSYVSRTSGSDAVGTPAGNDGRAFFDSLSFSLSFVPSSVPAVNQAGDFSMGVGGVAGRAAAVAEPASLALAALALAGAAASRRRHA